MQSAKIATKMMKYLLIETAVIPKFSNETLLNLALEEVQNDVNLKDPARSAPRDLAGADRRRNPARRCQGQWMHGLRGSARVRCVAMPARA